MKLLLILGLAAWRCHAFSRGLRPWHHTHLQPTLNTKRCATKFQDLPFQMIQGGAYIDFKYDDSPSNSAIRLLVDTGAANTIVRPSEESRGLENLKIRSLANPSIVAQAKSASNTIQFPPGVGGVLGLDFFQTYSVVEFDYQASTCRFYEDTSTLLSSKYISLPFVTRSVGLGSLLFINVNFGDCTTLSLIDSGSPVTIVTPETSNKAGMTSADTSENGITSTGVDGTSNTLEAVRCKKLHAGPFEVRDALLYSGAIPMAAATGLTGQPFALLGLDMLAGNSSRSFAIDFVNKIIHLGKITPPIFTQEEKILRDIRMLSLGEIASEIALLGLTCGPVTDESTDITSFPSREDLEKLLLDTRLQSNVGASSTNPTYGSAPDAGAAAVPNKSQQTSRISTSSSYHKSETMGSVSSKDITTIPLVILQQNGGVDIVSKNSDAVLRPSSLGRFIACRIKAPGWHKLLMLLDTACSGVVLRPRAARRIGLAIQSSPLIMSGAGGNLRPDVATVPWLEFEGERPVRTGAQLFPVQEMNALPDEFDGIAGLSLIKLLGVAVDFDFVASEARFYKQLPAVGPPGRVSLGLADMTYTRDGIPTVNLWVNGRGPAKLIVDTGASSTIFGWNKGGIETLGLRRPPLGQGSDTLILLQSTGAMGADGSALELTHRLNLKRASFQEDSVVNLINDKVDIDIGDLPIFKTLSSEGVGGVLGTDVFMQRAVLRIDFFNSRIELFE